jgi:uncharacterized protein
MPAPLLIDIARIPDEGLDLAYLEADLRAWGAEGLWDPGGPVEAAVRLARSAGGVLAEGWVETAVRLACSRCSEAFTHPVREEFAVQYLPAPAAPAPEERELAPAELEVDFLRGETLDVGALVRENVLLGLPAQPLCRAECRGLCPRCGTNLNLGPCGCVTEAGDPRLRILKRLL